MKMPPRWPYQHAYADGPSRVGVISHGSGGYPGDSIP